MEMVWCKIVLMASSLLLVLMNDQYLISCARTGRRQFPPQIAILTDIDTDPGFPRLMHWLKHPPITKVKPAKKVAATDSKIWEKKVIAEVVRGSGTELKRLIVVHFQTDITDEQINIDIDLIMQWATTAWKEEIVNTIVSAGLEVLTNDPKLLIKYWYAFEIWLEQMNNLVNRFDIVGSMMANMQKLQNRKIEWISKKDFVEKSIVLHGLLKHIIDVMNVQINDHRYEHSSILPLLTFGYVIIKFYESSLQEGPGFLFLNDKVVSQQKIVRDIEWWCATYEYGVNTQDMDSALLEDIFYMTALYADVIGRISKNPKRLEHPVVLKLCNLFIITMEQHKHFLDRLLHRPDRKLERSLPRMLESLIRLWELVTTDALTTQISTTLDMYPEPSVSFAFAKIVREKKKSTTNGGKAGKFLKFITDPKKRRNKKKRYDTNIFRSSRSAPSRNHLLMTQSSASRHSSKTISDTSTFAPTSAAHTVKAAHTKRVDRLVDVLMDDRSRIAVI